MDLITSLERKYSKYAIKNLMKYIVIATAIIYVLNLALNTFSIKHNFIISVLSLKTDALLQGQIWRLLSFIVTPNSSGSTLLDPIFLLFELYMLFLFGSALESYWGSFRLNVFYLIGVVATIIGALLVGGASSVYLNLSVFLAFAYVYPNFKILVFFILPVKVKYLAFFSIAFTALTVITSPFLEIKVAAIMSLTNFFVFFGKDALGKIQRTKFFQNSRKKIPVFKKSTPNKNLFKVKSTYTYKCTVCGRSSKDYPELKFGYCIKCGSDYEYCQDHLPNHTHKKSNE